MVRLICSFYGMPSPTVLWFKGDQNISTYSDKRVQLLDDGKILEINNFEMDDEANYKCIVFSRLGNDSREIDLRIERKLTA